MLAKKIALARYQKKPEPFRKIEFPTLRDIALEEVARSFELYPQLSDLPEKLKETVFSFQWKIYTFFFLDY